MRGSIRFGLTTSGASVSNGLMAMLTRSRSLIITEVKMTKLTPVHPGEILMEEFLTPLGISKNKLAIDLGIPASRIRPGSQKAGDRSAPTRRFALLFTSRTRPSSG